MSSEQAPSAPVVLGITGASGAVYGVRLLQCLAIASIPVELVVSDSGREVIRHELGISLPSQGASGGVESLLTYVWPNGDSWPKLSKEVVIAGSSLIRIYDRSDFFSPIASGSHLTRGMIVCPCSGTTLSAISHSLSDNLIVRAAEVHLKEHRKLILVNRETPLSVFQLENMHRLAQAGAVILPAMPGWYHEVRSVVDLVDFVVARILDHVQVPHRLMQRWGEASLTELNSTRAPREEPMAGEEGVK